MYDGLTESDSYKIRPRRGARRRFAMSERVLRVSVSPKTNDHKLRLSVTSSVAKLNCGSIGFHCVSCVSTFSTFPESQSNRLSCKYDSTGASQSDPVYAHV